MLQNNQKKAIKLGVVFKITEKGLLLSIQFVISVILARILSPEDYGLIAIINPFVAIPMIIFESGFCQALIQNKNVNRVHIDTIFIVNIVLSLIIYCFIFCLAYPISKFYSNLQIDTLLKLYSISIVVASVSHTYNSMLIRNLRFKEQMYFSFISAIISGVVGIVLAYKEFGVYSLVYQYLTYRVIYMLGIMVISKYIPHFHFSCVYFKSAFVYSWKIIASRILSTGSNELRNLFIGKLYTTDITGYYNKGYQLPSIAATAFDYSLQSVMFSAFSKEQSNIHALKAMLKRTIKTTSFIVFPLLFGLIATARPLVIVLFTEKWLPIVPFIQLCSLAFIFQTIQTPNYQALNAMGLTNITFKTELAKRIVEFALIIVTVFINIYLLAISYIVVSLVGVVFYLKISQKLLKYSFRDGFVDIIPSLIPSVMMLLCIIPLNALNIRPICILFLQIILGITAYIVFCYVCHNDSLKYSFSFVVSLIKKKR